MSGRGIEPAVTPPPPTIYETSTGLKYVYRDGFYNRPIEAATEVPRLYKSVAAKGIAPIAKPPFEWPLPTQNEDGSWTPGDWVEPANMQPMTDGVVPLDFCQVGLHAFDGAHYAEWLSYARDGGGVYVIEFDGPVAFSQQKWLGARARLVRAIPYQPLYDLLYTSGKNDTLMARLMRVKLNSRGNYYRKATLADWQSERRQKIEYRLRDEWMTRRRAMVVEKNAKALAPIMDEIKAALEAQATNKYAWSNFMQSLDERRRAAVTLVRAEQRVSRVIEGKSPGRARKSSLALVKKWAGFQRLLSIPEHHYYFQPWEETKRGQTKPSWADDIKVVGAQWQAEFAERARQELATSNETAAEEWALVPDDITFDTAVDMLIADPTAFGEPSKPEAKRRGR